MSKARDEMLAILIELAAIYGMKDGWPRQRPLFYIREVVIIMRMDVSDLEKNASLSVLFKQPPAPAPYITMADILAETGEWRWDRLTCPAPCRKLRKLRPSDVW